MKNFSKNSIEKAFAEKLLLLLPEGGSVVVAFSGGCDSLCLLALCAKVLGSKKVHALYVNHNIREAKELKEELKLNYENCKALGLELSVKELEQGLVSDLARSTGRGVEDAARTLRYEALEEYRKKTGSAFVLTAHHRQDQLETIIMRLGRGAPFSSLKGISELDSKRCLIRPLLDFKRRDLEDYVTCLGLKWSTDSTNSDSKYLRNHIRNNVLPSVDGSFEGYENILLELRQKALEKKEVGEKIKSPLCLSVFEGLDAASCIQIIYKLWDSVFTTTELPLSLASRTLNAIRQKKDLSIGSNKALFSIYNNKLYLDPDSKEQSLLSFEEDIDIHSDLLVHLPYSMVLRSGFHARGFLDEKKTLRLESGAFKGRVTVRFAREGDFVRLVGGAKKVMRLLQDMKIAPQRRPFVPVLVDQDGICAVFGSVEGGKDRICAKFHSSLAPNEIPQYIVVKG